MTPNLTAFGLAGGHPAFRDPVDATRTSPQGLEFCRGMIARLAAVAVGGYGRSELAPGSDLDLLFLLPESQSLAGAATETCVKMVVAGLWDLGFVLDHAVRSPRACIDTPKQAP